MFTERQLKILSFILSGKNWVNGSVLAQNFNISNKTIQKEIKSINMILGSKGNIQSNNQKGYIILELDEEIKNMVIDNEDKKIDTESTYGRSRLIIVLLIFQRDYISMGKIAERLYLSKATVNMQMMQVKRILNRLPDSYLEISQVKGVLFHSDENTKRILLEQCIETRVNYAEVLQDSIFLKVDEMTRTAYKFLKEIFIEHNYIISGNAFQQFVTYIIISILRSQKGFCLEKQEYNTELNILVLQIAEQVENKFNYLLSRDELYTIQSYLHERKFIRKEINRSNEIRKKVELFCLNVKKDLNVDLSSDNRFLEMFVPHLEQLIIRIQNGHSIINYYTKEIFQKYPLETHLVKVYLQNSLDIEISDPEIGYLIMYLVSDLESCRKKYSILLISNYDTSFLFNLHQILSNQLGITLDKIDIIPMYIYESRKEEYLLQYDIFVTTEKEVIFQDREFIYFNSILDKQEIKKVGERIHHLHEESKKKNLEMLKMKYVVSEHIVSSKNNKEFIDDILNEFSLVINKNTCFNSLNENTLFISMFDLEQSTSEIWEISLDNSLQYYGKNISRIIFVRYVRDGNSVIDFYDMVTSMLKTRSFDLVKKKR